MSTDSMEPLENELQAFRNEMKSELTAIRQVLAILIREIKLCRKDISEVINVKAPFEAAQGNDMPKQSVEQVRDLITEPPACDFDESTSDFSRNTSKTTYGDETFEINSCPKDISKLIDVKAPFEATQENQMPEQIVEEVSDLLTVPKEPSACDFDDTTSDFSQIASKRTYVDKTMLIRWFFMENEHKKIILAAPRHFMKSTNLDMIKRFVEIQVDNNGVVVDKEKSSNRKIFEENNLLIFQNRCFFDRYFGTYPVIHIDFRHACQYTTNNVLVKLGYVFRATFKQHQYWLVKNHSEYEWRMLSKFNNDTQYQYLKENDFIQSFLFLIAAVYVHYGNRRVFVLVDDYEDLICDILQNSVNFEIIKGLLENIYMIIYQSTYVECAILTGAPPFYSQSFNYHDKFTISTILNTEFYALTEDEVNKLLTDFIIDSDTKEKVKFSYGGYMTESGTNLFSTWSILNFLLRKRGIRNYWKDSYAMSIFEDKIISNGDYQVMIKKVCLGMSLDIHTANKNLFHYIAPRHLHILSELGDYHSFLVYRGYLALTKKEGSQYQLRAANIETINLLREAFFNYCSRYLGNEIYSCVDTFNKISSTTTDEVFIDFITKFNKLLHQFNTTFRYEEDKELNARFLMLLMLYKSKFSPIIEFTEEPVLGWDNLGIIINVCYGKSPNWALEKLFDKYISAPDKNPFPNDVNRYIYIGMNVNEDAVADMSVLVDSQDLSKAKVFSKME